MSSTIPQTDDWPRFNDELTRKTVATLNKWVSAYNAGAITRREAYILVSGLYDATSGLIDRDIMDMMADLHKELRDA